MLTVDQMCYDYESLVQIHRDVSSDAPVLLSSTEVFGFNQLIVWVFQPTKLLFQVHSHRSFPATACSCDLSTVSYLSNTKQEADKVSN